MTHVKKKKSKVTFEIQVTLPMKVIFMYNNLQLHA